MSFFTKKSDDSRRYPFSPESPDLLKKRFSKSLEVFYNEEKKKELMGTISSCSENIFDFFDGTRIIVSREEAASSLSVTEIIHVSGSCVPNGEVHKRFESCSSVVNLMYEIDKWITSISDRFRFLSEGSGVKTEPIFTSVEDCMVVHIIYPHGEKREKKEEKSEKNKKDTLDPLSKFKSYVVLDELKTLRNLALSGNKEALDRLREYVAEFVKLGDDNFLAYISKGVILALELSLE